MPSSSLAEIEVEVGVEVWVGVKVEVWVGVGVLVKMQFSFLTFFAGGDGVVGEVRYKANLNSSCS